MRSTSLTHPDDLMKYVLDTNVIKRFGGAKPNANVRKWHATVNDNDIYITAMSIQEISKGVGLARRSGGASQMAAAAAIEQSLRQLIEEFGGRILPIDAPAAIEWGRRLARHGTKNANDLAIMAIVAANRPAAALTQNLSDFRHRGIEVINPYEDPPLYFHDAET